MSLPETVIEWRGLSLYGTPGPGRLTFRTLDGWEGAEGRQELTERPVGDGAFDAPVYGRSRTVLVSGRVGSPQARDEVLAQLGAAFALQRRDQQVAPLRITHAGRTLTAAARLLRFAPTATAWAAGWFDWAAEWRRPDPFRYGDPVPAATAFARPGGALRHPLFTDGQSPTGVLMFGPDDGPTGVVEVTNPGTADAWLVLQITGPTPVQGVDVLVAGSRIRYAREVPAGEVLTIDTATGRARLSDGADRDTALTVRQWRPIHPGETAEVWFVPLGGATAGSLGVTVRPTYW